jgi:hypothetical protein
MARNKKTDESTLTSIDLLRLEEEWATHADRYKEYADMLADARKEAAEASAALDVADALLDKKIRTNPEDFDIDPKKVTEGAIKAKIIVQKKHTAANQAVIDANHRVNILQGAVGALDHRKRALEKLVDLWLAWELLLGPTCQRGNTRSPRGQEDQEGVHLRQKD